MKRTGELFTTASRRRPLPPLLASAAIVLAFVAAPASAVDEHHPEAAAGSTAPSAQASTPETGPTIEKMQENVRQMQSQLERAANAKTDDDRRAALVDHMRTMQANMMLGRSMMMAAGGYSGTGGGMDPRAVGSGMAGPGMMSGMMGSGMMCPGMMGHGMMNPGMMNPGMMNPGMMNPGMIGRAQSGEPDSADLHRMERRLDMMQMMIEQMMRSRSDQPSAAPSMPAR